MSHLRLKPEPCNKGLDNATLTARMTGCTSLGSGRSVYGHESVTMYESDRIPQDNAMGLWHMHGHGSIDG